MRIRDTEYAMLLYPIGHVGHADGTDVMGKAIRHAGNKAG